VASIILKPINFNFKSFMLVNHSVRDAWGSAEEKDGPQLRGGREEGHESTGASEERAEGGGQREVGAHTTEDAEEGGEGGGEGAGPAGVFILHVSGRSGNVHERVPR
jgi:hypothetical protein